jgi:hypothetical protein
MWRILLALAGTPIFQSQLMWRSNGFGKCPSDVAKLLRVGRQLVALNLDAAYVVGIH